MELYYSLPRQTDKCIHMLLLGCGLVMNCQTAKEYLNLYADDMLNKEETELLFSHISSCVRCKKELDEVMALKKAFAGIKEIEPPAGLALSAIKKAKKRKVPVFAYASAGVAAVIALVAIFSSGIINYSNDSGQERVANSAQYSKAMVAEAEMNVCASEAPAAGVTFAPAAAPANEGSYDAAGAPSESFEATLLAPREADVPYISVPADVSDSFKQVLYKFLSDNSITYQNYVNGNNDSIAFTIMEDKLDELRKIIEEAFPYEGKLSAGYVQFIFSK